MTTPLSLADLDLSEEARLLATGKPTEGGEALLVGTLEACLEEAFLQDAEARSQLCIWTSGSVYGPEDIEALRPQMGGGDPGPIVG